MKTITLNQLESLGFIESVDVLSLDGDLYTVWLSAGGEQYRLLGDNAQPYSRRSVEKIKQDLSACAIGSMGLVQQSAYDEMIGHPVSGSANQMRVPVALPEKALPEKAPPEE